MKISHFNQRFTFAAGPIPMRDHTNASNATSASRPLANASDICRRILRSIIFRWICLDDSIQTHYTIWLLISGLFLLQCDICLKHFKSARILRGHKKIHNEPQFNCEICKKKFSRRYHLTLHMKRHDKPSTTKKAKQKNWIQLTFIHLEANMFYTEIKKRMELRLLFVDLMSRISSINTGN